jgi:hypothetical protein
MQADITTCAAWLSDLLSLEHGLTVRVMGKPRNLLLLYEAC